MPFLRKLMELWLVYTLIAAYTCRIAWLILRKTSLLERITRWRKTKPKKKKKRESKDGCDNKNGHTIKSSKTDTKLDKDAEKATGQPMKNTAKKKTNKVTKDAANVKEELAKITLKKPDKETDKADEDAAKAKDILAKKASKKITDDTKMDKDAAKVKDKVAKNTSKKKADKENKVDQALASENATKKSKKSKKSKSKTKTGKAHTGNKIEFHQILAALSTLVLSDEEAAKVVAVLRQKTPFALDAGHMELKEEKLKAVCLEEQLNDQQGAQKSELKLRLAKAQAKSKEMESVKMRFQQLTNEKNKTISQLKRENAALKDVVETSWQRISQTCSCRL